MFIMPIRIMKALSLIFFMVISASAADKIFTGPQEIGATVEILSSDDIRVRSYLLNYSGTEGDWKFDVGVGLNEYDLAYSPVLFGTDETLSAETSLLNLGLTRKLNSEWSGTVKLSAYDGYSDYRSIWIAEFYNQFFGGFQDYYDPDPHGFSVGTTLKWDYLPGSGSAALSVDYGRDEIAPGWSFDPATGRPEPGRESLDTVSGILRVDQALNGWLKSELELSVRQITSRDARYGIRHSWAAAAGPLGFRLTGGYTQEAPTFDAAYGVAVVEWKFLPQWTCHAGYRVYRDSGEIQVSGFNALAPPVNSTELFAGLLWERQGLSVSAGVGLLETDYEPLSEDNKFFGNLYRDRDWVTFRVSASLQF
jgi:hypothetical protein